jgi:site-specific DNA-methyltransferase (adenine-specific)
VSRREAHDASAFYERFPVPEICDDDEIKPHVGADCLWVGDARDMDAYGDVADDSVALVVTSPPYYAGKEYEQAVGHGHVPASYVDYLKMLEDVFRECVRKLEPGGRIAVNVANLGRRPYRSLSADVIAILQDRLRLLLRGEVVWQKAKGATGSCAWGSFQQPGNPVLRDLTERVVIASKGRFDRARPAAARAEEGWPSDGSAHVDEFMEATTDVWDIPPASATRVGHPAPFPVELPERLIELYTYRGDLILDPFVGAGTTAVAAVRTGRRYAGFDTDASYIELAERRIVDERQRLKERSDRMGWSVTASPSAKRRSDSQFFMDLADSLVASNGSSPHVVASSDSSDTDDFQARAGREGRKAQVMAKAVLLQCGFDVVEEKVKKPCGVEVNFEAYDRSGRKWFFDVSGAFSVTQRPGLRRTDTLWKALGKAAVLHSVEPDTPLVLLTTDRPAPNSAGHRALRSLIGSDKPVRDVIRMLSPDDLERLADYAQGAS